MKYKSAIIGIGGAGAITIKRMKENLNMPSIVIDIENNDAADEIELINKDEYERNTDVFKLSDTDLSKISNVVAKYDLLILCVGLGGKTGTNVTPIISRLAKSQNKLVVTIMYKPFTFEGRLRNSIAEKATLPIVETSDFSIIVSNDTLAKLSPLKQTFSKTFSLVDIMIFKMIETINTVAEDNHDSFQCMKDTLICKLRDIASKSELIESCS